MDPHFKIKGGGGKNKIKHHRGGTGGCGVSHGAADRRIPPGGPGGRRIQRCLCEGRRVRGSAGTPRAIRGGRRIQQPLPQEGASAGRGSGEEDPAKSFTEGGGSGETRQSVCLARSGIRGQAGEVGGGIPRLSPCPPQGSGRDPGGRREELRPGGRRGAGQPRRRRVPGEPQQRLGQGRSVRRGAEGEGGGRSAARRLSRSLSPRPLAGQAVPGSVLPDRSPAPPRRRRCRRCRPGEQRSRCRRCRRRGHFVAD